jgi:hypothetical protein
VDGPVLVVPMAGQTQIAFNPNELIPLEGHGTVYPTLRVSDAWGVLDVSDGALLSWETGSVRVAAPSDKEARSGPGWTLSLEPGWMLTPGDRERDFKLIRKAPQGS